ncbi:MAG: HAD family phosphatase [candidate division KSB1 bacterium]|nr:HAD family phosphatase [candidate division KSB1 bacterium]
MIKAVLLDFDGVVVNSLPYHIQAWQKVLAPYGIKIDPKEIYLSEGLRAIDYAKIISLREGLNLSPSEINDLVDRKRQYYRLISQARVRPEAIAFIDNLKKTPLKVGLVTGSGWVNLKTIAGDGFLDKFDVIVSGDDVTKGKPDPEAYLNAAKKLGLTPSECLVIENAPLGIQAAKRAGMACVAITVTLEAKELKEADYIFSDLNEIDLAGLLENGRL